jgi:hypothetical protein
LLKAQRACLASKICRVEGGRNRKTKRKVGACKRIGGADKNIEAYVVQIAEQRQQDG